MDKLTIYFILVSICSKVVWSEILEHESPRRVGVESRITGGNQTTIEEHPHMAYLVARGELTFVCGGSILSRRHIVTAARCLDGARSIDITIGSTERGSGGQQYTSTVYMNHPMFMSGSSDYDVGVILVEEGMVLNGNTVRAIELVELDDDPATGEEITITGYGEVGPGIFDSFSDTLLEATLTVMNRAECQSQNGAVTDRSFCAIDERNMTAAACESDRGGPAVGEDNLLAGIISSGNRCRPQTPLVLTRLGEAQIRSFVMMMSGQ